MGEGQASKPARPGVLLLMPLSRAALLSGDREWDTPLPLFFAHVKYLLKTKMLLTGNRSSRRCRMCSTDRKTQQAPAPCKEHQFCLVCLVVKFLLAGDDDQHKTVQNAAHKVNRNLQA